MIQIDMFSKEKDNIQLSGDYKTVACEIAKALASYLVVYVKDADETTRQTVMGHIYSLTLKMLPDVEKQIKETGIVSKIPRNFLKQLKEDIEINEDKEE